MNAEKLDSIRQALGAGHTFTAACSECGVSAVEMARLLRSSPDRKLIYASLCLAEADGLTLKADGLRERLSNRIDKGLVRTGQLASVETREIERVDQRASELRNHAASILELNSPTSQNWYDRMLSQKT